MVSKSDWDDYVEGMPGTPYGEMGIKHQRQLSGQTNEKKYVPSKPVKVKKNRFTVDRPLTPKTHTKARELPFNKYWFWSSFIIILIYMLSIDENWMVSLLASLIGGIMIATLWQFIVVGLVLVIIYFTAKFFI